MDTFRSLQPAAFFPSSAAALTAVLLALAALPARGESPPPPARSQLDALREDGWQRRHFPALAHLQTSCAKNRETKILINLRTGEFTDVAFDFDHLERPLEVPVLDGYRARAVKIGKKDRSWLALDRPGAVEAVWDDPANADLLECHCHPVAGLMRPLAAGAGGAVEDGLRALAGKLPSSLDVQSGAIRLGRFHRRRPGEDYGLCVLAARVAARPSGVPASVEYGLTPAALETARYVARELDAAGADAGVTFTATGLAIEPLTVGGRTFSPLEVYASAKAHDYAEAVRDGRPGARLDAARGALFARYRRAIEDGSDVFVRELPFPAELVKPYRVYLRERQRRLRRDATTRDETAAALVERCGAASLRAAAGLLSEQQEWLWRRKRFRTPGAVTTSGDRASEHVELHVVPRALLSCNVTGEWTRKATIWRVVSGDGRERTGVVDDTGLVEGAVARSDGTLQLAGTRYDGSRHVWVFRPGADDAG